MFNFQSATCENAEVPSRDQTVQGTRLLSRRGASDFVLLEVEIDAETDTGAG